jgi:AAA15 family ATPase/GTPase
MVIEFTVGNFLSFKDPVTFSMESVKISELEESNVFSFDKLKLLKSAVIYGANASGKSNLVKAMGFMKWFVLNSSKETQVEEPIKIENFRLSTETENKPSFFEIVFICDQKKYRYGFEIDKEKIHSEWLFFNPTRQEAKLFVREGEEIEIGTTYFKEGRKRKELVRSNALFLSTVAQLNGEISTQILKWFGQFHSISGLNDMIYMGFTIKQLKDEDYRQRFLEYLKKADFGIDDINIEKAEETKISEMLDEMGKLLSKEIVEKIKESSDFNDISTLHSKYDDKHGRLPDKVEFALLKNESEGTRKFFNLLGPILDTLDKGSILVVDELDARFHPFITRFIIHLFHSKQTNPNNAQLIFATHDTNLLDKNLFRRDQVWFTEKDQYGATYLYSLAEYKVRNDKNFEKNYIKGKFGAVPFIGNIEILLGDKK